MGKRIKVSLSLDEDFIVELNQTIEKYHLANRSRLIQDWSRKGFKQLKKDLGLPKKREIFPEV